jgi:hypothetical protein
MTTEVESQKKSHRPFWFGVLVGFVLVVLAVGSGIYLGGAHGKQGPRGVAGPVGPAGPKGDSAVTATLAPSPSPGVSVSPSPGASVSPSPGSTPGASDVVISSCGVGSMGYPTARLTVTNSDNVPHNYTIKVTFPPLAGFSGPAQDEVQVNSLLPGASIDETADWQEKPTAAFKCVIAPNGILRI